eukprot:752524-Hanusia_phi.AAC.8
MTAAAGCASILHASDSRSSAMPAMASLVSAEYIDGSTTLTSCTLAAASKAVSASPGMGPSASPQRCYSTCSHNFHPSLPSLFSS